MASEPSTQPPISAVVWDFGGVLITPITNLFPEVADWHDRTVDEMLDILLGPRDRSTPDHPWHCAERGELPTAAMQTAVAPFAEAAGVTLRGNEYERLLRGEFTVRDEVVARIAGLREQGYLTGLLTNSFVEFRPVIEERIPFTLFDVVVDSSEVGCRKPEPQIYELTAERLGVPPEEILYLDEFEGNLDGARSAGWRTIHVTGGDHIISDLDAALASARSVGSEAGTGD